MADENTLPRGIQVADKAALLEIVEEQDRVLGFVPDPTASVEKLRAMMLANGVRPEENLGSREIIRMRDGDDESPPHRESEGGNQMALTDEKLPGIKYADKKALLKILEEYNRETGFVPDPNVTAQEVREMMIACGVRPEENSGSREIIRIREGEEQ